MVALAAAALLLGAGCAQQAHGPRFQPSGTMSASAPSEADQQQSPFGGKPAVDIPPQARAMGAFLQAEVATEVGDRTEALKALEEAVQYDPGNATLRVTLATLYVRDGRLTDARVQADQSVKLDPGSSRGLLLAAGIDSALGDDSNAEQDYKEVIKLSPKNQEAYLFLGTLYAKRGDYDQARKVFEQLIALDPQSFLGYYYAGPHCVRIRAGATTRSQFIRRSCKSILTTTVRTSAWLNCTSPRTPRPMRR
jgi:predicted Zn-dependent protease